jgi:hypothetical protein
MTQEAPAWLKTDAISNTPNALERKTKGQKKRDKKKHQKDPETSPLISPEEFKNPYPPEAMKPTKSKSNISYFLNKK